MECESKENVMMERQNPAKDTDKSTNVDNPENSTDLTENDLNTTSDNEVVASPAFLMNSSVEGGDGALINSAVTAQKEQSTSDSALNIAESTQFDVPMETDLTVIEGNTENPEMAPILSPEPSYSSIPDTKQMSVSNDLFLKPIITEQLDDQLDPNFDSGVGDHNILSETWSASNGQLNSERETNLTNFAAGDFRFEEILHIKGAMDVGEVLSKSNTEGVHINTDLPPGDFILPEQAVASEDMPRSHDVELELTLDETREGKSFDGDGSPSVCLDFGQSHWQKSSLIYQTLSEALLPVYNAAPSKAQDSSGDTVLINVLNSSFNVCKGWDGSWPERTLHYFSTRAENPLETTSPALASNLKHPTPVNILKRSESGVFKRLRYKGLTRPQAWVKIHEFRTQMSLTGEKYMSRIYRQCIDTIDATIEEQKMIRNDIKLTRKQRRILDKKLNTFDNEQRLLYLELRKSCTPQEAVREVDVICSKTDEFDNVLEDGESTRSTPVSLTDVNDATNDKTFGVPLAENTEQNQCYQLYPHFGNFILGLVRHPNCKHSLDDLIQMAEKMYPDHEMYSKKLFILQCCKYGVDPVDWNWKLCSKIPSTVVPPVQSTEKHEQRHDSSSKPSCEHASCKFFSALDAQSQNERNKDESRELKVRFRDDRTSGTTSLALGEPGSSSSNRFKVNQDHRMIKRGKSLKHIDSQQKMKNSSENNRPTEQRHHNATIDSEPEQDVTHVYVVCSGYPDELLSEEQISKIEDCIFKRVSQIEDERMRPNLNLFPCKGRYKVICMDQYSKEWLSAFLRLFPSSLKIIPVESGEMCAVPESCDSRRNQLSQPELNAQQSSKQKLQKRLGPDIKDSENRRSSRQCENDPWRLDWRSRLGRIIRDADLSPSREQSISSFPVPANRNSDRSNHGQSDSSSDIDVRNTLAKFSRNGEQNCVGSFPHIQKSSSNAIRYDNSVGPSSIENPNVERPMDNSKYMDVTNSDIKEYVHSGRQTEEHLDYGGSYRNKSLFRSPINHNSRDDSPINDSRFEQDEGSVHVPSYDSGDCGESGYNTRSASNQSSQKSCYRRSFFRSRSPMNNHSQYIERVSVDDSEFSRDVTSERDPDYADSEDNYGYTSRMSSYRDTQKSQDRSSFRNPFSNDIQNEPDARELLIQIRSNRIRNHSPSRSQYQYMDSISHYSDVSQKSQSSSTHFSKN